MDETEPTHLGNAEDIKQSGDLLTLLEEYRALDSEIGVLLKEKHKLERLLNQHGEWRLISRLSGWRKPKNR